MVDKKAASEPKEKISTLKESVDKLRKENKDEAKKTTKDDKAKLKFSRENIKVLTAQKLAAARLAADQRKIDDGIAADVAMQLRVTDWGMKGMIANGKETIRGFLMMDKTFGEGLADIGNAFKQDMAFLGQMMAPLTAIPGVSTALTAVKFAVGKLLQFVGKILSATLKRMALFIKKWTWDKAVNSKSAQYMKGLLKNSVKRMALFMKRWTWDKAVAMKNKLRARGRALKKDGSPDMRTKKKPNKLLKFIKLFFKGALIVVLALIAFVAGFFKSALTSIRTGFTKLFAGPWNKIKKFFNKFKPKWANAKSVGAVFKGPWDKIKNAFKGIKLPPGVTSAMAKVQGFFGKSKSGISNAFTKIRGWLKPAGDAISKMMKSPIVKFAGQLGKNLGKLAWPITLLMGVWASVTGWIEGWNNTEGGIWGKITGALSGGVEKLLNFFIFSFMDFIKDIINWIGQKLGLIGPEMGEAIDDFSFVEIFSKLWEGLTNIALGVQNWFQAILSGAWAAVKAAWPGGETPAEAFKKAYGSAMESGQAVYKSQALIDIDAAEIEKQADANKRDVDKNRGDAADVLGEKTEGGGPPVITATSNFTGGPKTYTTDSSGPTDLAAAAMAGAVP